MGVGAADRLGPLIRVQPLAKFLKFLAVIRAPTRLPAKPLTRKAAKPLHLTTPHPPHLTTPPPAPPNHPVVVIVVVVDDHPGPGVDVYTVATRSP